MPTVQDYVDQISSKVDSYPARASKLQTWGWIARWPALLTVIAIVGASVLVVTIATSQNNIFLANLARHLRMSVVGPHPDVWSLLYRLGPAAWTAGESNTGAIVWYLRWTCWIVAMRWFGDSAIKKAKALNDLAADDEPQLQFHEPTWRGIEQMTYQMQVMQAAIGAGSSFGGGNTINVVSQVNSILQRPEPAQGWWTKPIGLVIIGLSINAPTKFLGFGGN